VLFYIDAKLRSSLRGGGFENILRRISGLKNKRNNRREKIA
jgi:hypothetical protein